MMATFTIQGVSHTGLTVSDLERSLQFYCGVLGFQVLFRAARQPSLMKTLAGDPSGDVDAAFIQAPGYMLELVQFYQPQEGGHVRARTWDTGATHLAFYVDNLDAVVTTLSAAGGSAWREPLIVNVGPQKGARIIQVRDPDGITLEFMQLAAP